MIIVYFTNVYFIIIYIHLFSKPLLQLKVTDSQSLGARQEPALARRPFLRRAHSHTQSLTHTGTMQTRRIKLHILGMWEETRVPGEKSNADVGRTHELLTDSGRGIDFFLIQVIRKQRFSKTCYTQVFISVSVLPCKVSRKHIILDWLAKANQCLPFSWHGI